MNLLEYIDWLMEQGIPEENANEIADSEFGLNEKQARIEREVIREMRRIKLERENVPDYSNRGPYGGDDICDIDICIS